MKFRASAVVLLALASCLVHRSPSPASTVSLGAQVWYAWWVPAWGNQDYTADPSITVSQSTELDRPDPAFMAGPTVSVGFLDRWSFSVAGAYGTYSTRGTRMPTATAIVFEETDIRKYDLDTALSYIINSFFKLYAGFKLQGYGYDKTLHQVVSPSTYRWETYKNTTYRSMGPALGIGITVPFGERLFLVWNTNALLLYAWEDTSMDKYTFDPALGHEHYAYSGRARLYGANTALSFAYFIPDSRLTVTAGFRYQLLRYVQDRSDVGEYNFDGKFDRFYGIVLGAMYSFNP